MPVANVKRARSKTLRASARVTLRSFHSTNVGLPPFTQEKRPAAGREGLLRGNTLTMTWNQMQMHWYPLGLLCVHTAS